MRECESNSVDMVWVEANGCRTTFNLNLSRHFYCYLSSSRECYVYPIVQRGCRRPTFFFHPFWYRRGFKIRSYIRVDGDTYNIHNKLKANFLLNIRNENKSITTWCWTFFYSTFFSIWISQLSTIKRIKKIVVKSQHTIHFIPCIYAQIFFIGK